MTAAEIGAVLEADMAAAVLAGEGPTASNGAAIRARIAAAYDDALVSLFTPWLSDDPVIPPGYVSFTKSAQHATVTNYQARLRAAGNVTVLDTQDLGVPVPDVYGVITADLNPLFTGQTPGSYTVSIATTTPGGTTDSTVSDAFTLPLS